MMGYWPGTGWNEKAGSVPSGIRLDAFDQDEFAGADGLANGAGSGVFGRMIATERILHGSELDQHIAGPGHPFQRFDPPAPRQDFGAELFKGRQRRRDIRLIDLRVTHIDAGNPVSLGHQAARSNLRLTRHSAICTALRAAPLRRLSDTTHIARPFS